MKKRQKKTAGDRASDVVLVLLIAGCAAMYLVACFRDDDPEEVVDVTISTTAETEKTTIEETTTELYSAGDHDGDPEETVTEAVIEVVAETEAPVYYEELTESEPVYEETTYTEAYTEPLYEEPETEAPTYIEVYEEPTEEETYAFEAPDYDAGNPYGFSDNEIFEIARITMLENGHCSWECCYLTASVIINRYLDWGYSDIYAVIYDEGQYSTAYSGCDFITDQVWDAVSTAIATPDRNPHYQAMFPQGEVYRQLPCGEYYCY